MQPLKRLRQFVTEDKLGSVSIYEIGAMNHLVVVCTGNFQKDVLCLGPEHADRIFQGCIKKFKEETIKN